MHAVQVSAALSAAVVGVGTIRYIYLIAKRRVQPVVASWIVSTVSMVLSLVTYWTSPKANFFGGFLNAVSFCTIFGILVPLLVMAHRDGKKIEFTGFQNKSLMTSGGIFVLWALIMICGGTGIVPNLLVQLLLVISYSMIIQKVWNLTKTTESLFLWWTVFIASGIGIYTAYLKHDFLSYVYAIRSVVMCGLLLFALHRIGWRGRELAEVAYGSHRANTL